jgi:hypothetical protein
MSLKENAAKLDAELNGDKNGDRKEIGKSKKSGAEAGARSSAKIKKTEQGAILLPDLDQKCADEIENALNATTKTWSPVSKSWVESPDTRTRLEAIKLFYAYRHGMPVQRVVKIEANFRDNDEQLLTLVQSSPEARAELIKAGVVTEEWIATKAKGLK